jgi:hypothetical protein
MKPIDLGDMAQYDNPYEILQQLAKNQVELQTTINTLASTMLNIMKRHSTVQQQLFEIVSKQNNLLQTYANIPDVELANLDFSLFLLSEQLTKTEQ